LQDGTAVVWVVPWRVIGDVGPGPGSGQLVEDGWGLGAVLPTQGAQPDDTGVITHIRPSRSARRRAPPTRTSQYGPVPPAGLQRVGTGKAKAPVQRTERGPLSIGLVEFAGTDGGGEYVFDGDSVASSAMLASSTARPTRGGRRGLIPSKSADSHPFAARVVNVFSDLTSAC
jgi:hypothetical protein